MAKVAVIYEGTPGIRISTPELTIVGALGEELVDTARQLVESGATRIELCGGVGTAESAAVRAAVPAGIRVGLNRYGFESLERITDYKRAFAAGDIRPAVFLFPASDAPDAVEHADGVFQPVRDLAHAESLGAEYARRGVGLVELYAGLGTDYAAAVLRGAGGSVPVGFVGYDD